MRRLLPLLLVAACAGGSAPDQPIRFNHALHAGKQHIPCTDCHAGATRADHAGLPSLRVCLACHMKPQGNPPSAAEGQVRALAAQAGPLPWIQVTRNPGHVRFSHAAHTTLGRMDCTACHGDVVAWTEPPHQPVARLRSMSTCMACHRARGVSNACLTCHH
jgi:c(7)-type cytochrome triheme protein